jgi:hypothetical protein
MLNQQPFFRACGKTRQAHYTRKTIDRAERSVPLHKDNQAVCRRSVGITSRYYELYLTRAKSTYDQRRTFGPSDFAGI